VDVDFYAPIRAQQALVYATPALVDGPHTMKIRAKGTKNASSTGTYITADRLDVAASASSQVSINDGTLGTGQNQWEFSGTWSNGLDAGAYQGDEHYSIVANSYYVVRFSGTIVALYATKDSHHGLAGVSIDGGAEVDVDFYAAIRTPQALVYTSPVLTDGNHAIRVRVQGTKGARSTGTTITADRATVTNGRRTN
jgi:hypothetical protein